MRSVPAVRSSALLGELMPSVTVLVTLAPVRDHASTTTDPVSMSTSALER